MDEIHFDGELWFWRGPSPYHFVSVPRSELDVVGSWATEHSYGWGMVPVQVRLGSTTWRTSLFPKDGGYVVPVRDSVRRGESLELGDRVSVALSPVDSDGDHARR